MSFKISHHHFQLDQTMVFLIEDRLKL